MNSICIKCNTSFEKICMGILVLLLCNVATAQVTLSIIDSKKKAAIEDVFVVAKNIESQKEFVGFTDSKGQLKLSISGKCKLQLKKLGYKIYEAETELHNNFQVALEASETELKDVVVTGHCTATTAQMAVNTIKTINKKKIEEMGAVTLRDVLTNQLNIRLTQDNVLGSSMNINGISGQNIKILIDGVPMIGRVNGNIDLSQINLNNIERIEIVEGPMSVVYGSDALGGVVNLISKRKVKDAFNYILNGYYESNGTYNTDARFALKKGNIELNISGGRNFFDGYDPNYKWENRTMQWKPRTQYFTDNSFTIKTKQSKHVLNGNFFTEKILNRGKPTVTPYSAYGFDEAYNTQRWGIGEQSDIYIKKSNHLQFINSFSYFRRIKNTYRKDLTNGNSEITPSASDQDTSLFYLLLFRGVWTNTVLKKFQFQAGYDFNLEFAKGQRLENNAQNIQDYALYATVQYNPIEKISLKIGVRGAYNTKYGTPVVPSFNFKYNINQAVSLRASYAMGFRAPSLKELSMLFVDINHNIQGNKKLKAERSHNAQLELNYEPQFKQFKFMLRPSVFFNHLYNMISLVLVDPSAQVYSYVNIDKFQSVGGNINAGITHKFFDIQLGTAYTGRYNSLSENAKVPHFGWSPEFTAALSVNIPKINTSIATFYKYNGAIPGYMLDAEGNIYQTTIQSYSTLDISVTARIWKERFIISTGAKNILNVKNINYNIAASTTHSSSNSSMSVGMGVTGFVSLKINLTNNFKNHE